MPRCGLALAVVLVLVVGLTASARVLPTSPITTRHRHRPHDRAARTALGARHRNDIRLKLYDEVTDSRPVTDENLEHADVDASEGVLHQPVQQDHWGGSVSRQAREANDPCQGVDYKQAIAQAITSKKLSVSHHVFQAPYGTLVAHWVGAPNPNVLVVVTMDEAKDAPNLYSSKDFGVTFELIDTGETIYEQLAIIEHGSQSSVYALPFDPTSTAVFVSHDSGTTFTRRQVLHHFDTIAPHSRDSKFLLATVAHEDGGAGSSKLFLCENAYAQGNLSFSLFAEGVIDYQWVTPRNQEQPPMVLFTQYNNKTAIDLWKIRAVSTGTPGGWTFQPGLRDRVKEDVDYFEQIHEYLFFTSAPSGDFGERELHVSTNNGNSFHKALFPTGGKEQNYHIVDASEDVVMAIVNHTVTKTEGVFGVEVTTAEGSTNVTGTKALWTPVLDAERSVAVGMVYGHTGCTATGGVPTSANGKLVLLDRGNCTFTEKVRNAEDVGAVAVVVTHQRNHTIRMEASNTAYPAIPAVFVNYTSGLLLKKAIASGGATARPWEADVTEAAQWHETNLYTSNLTGIAFTLSLSFVGFWTFPGLEIVDVLRVDSQPGTYIANAYTPYLASWISFNKGGSWAPLAAGMHETDCGSCSLHLCLEAAEAVSGIPLPATLNNSAGLIFANGVFEHFATLTVSKASIWVSDNGGLSWSLAQLAEDQDRPHMIQMLDHGSVIAAVPYAVNATEIQFSVDQGHTWDALPFTEAKDGFVVDQITSEDDASTLALYVAYYDHTNGVWTGGGVNFQGVMTTQCSENDDYEVYEPATQHSDCLLGDHTMLKRKSPCKLCYNGLDFVKFEDDTSTRQPCDCTVWDTKCAWGFYRQPGEEECKRDTGVPLVCPRSVLLPVYELVSGEGCSASTKFSHDYLSSQEVYCDGRHPYDHGSKWLNIPGLAVVAIILVVVAIMIVAVVLCRSPAIRERISNFFSAPRLTYQELASINDGFESDEDDEMLGTDDDDLMAIGLNDISERQRAPSFADKIIKGTLEPGHDFRAGADSPGDGNSDGAAATAAAATGAAPLASSAPLVPGLATLVSDAGPAQTGGEASGSALAPQPDATAGKRDSWEPPAVLPSVERKSTFEALPEFTEDDLLDDDFDQDASHL